jgi:hypothetical protein
LEWIFLLFTRVAASSLEAQHFRFVPNAAATE